jgi:hypothetical protein
MRPEVNRGRASGPRFLRISLLFVLEAPDKDAIASEGRLLYGAGPGPPGIIRGRPHSQILVVSWPGPSARSLARPMWDRGPRGAPYAAAR